MARKRLAPPAPAAVYSVHPSIAMVQNWIAKLPATTGRTLEQWIALVVQEGPAEEKDRREWLKSKHKLGTNSAWWIAERASGKGGEDGDPEAYLRAAPEYVEAMFAGSKTGLRPMYERLIAAARALGDDIKICPCKTIVPIYRQHVFAQLKPSTRTRLDLGLCLRGEPFGGRLLDTGGQAKDDRITHRIALQSLDEIDAEVERWLRTAYERDSE
jgi:hypothetical protein